MLKMLVCFNVHSSFETIKRKVLNSCELKIIRFKVSGIWPKHDRHFFGLFLVEIRPILAPERLDFLGATNCIGHNIEQN